MFTSRQKKTQNQPKEQEVLAFIYEFQRLHKSLPSARQISTHLGFKSSRSAQNYIESLKDKGLLLHRLPETSSYKLPEPVAAQAETIPLLGSIAAGSPLTVYAEESRLMPIPAGFFGKSERLFALQVQGNSMSGDHICDGDFAVIRSWKEGVIEKAHIYALRIGSDEYTLKRVRVIEDHVELLSSNPDYPVMRISSEDIEIVGVYVGLWRRQ